MTIVFTAGARADLDNILAYTKRYHPRQLSKLEERIKNVIARVERRPRSATAVTQRSEVRVVLLIRYPFKIFFREIPGGVEILHIYHTARDLP